MQRDEHYESLVDYADRSITMESLTEIPLEY